MHLRHRCHSDIRLSLKIKHMPLADQAIADETDTDPIIGADDAVIRGGGQNRGRARLHKFPSTEIQPGGWLHFCLQLLVRPAGL